MQNDAENILWSRYLEDFLHLRLLPENYTDLGSEDLSVEILTKYFEPLNCEPNIVRRLVSLHTHVHIHQLDGVQLISILSILTKTCVSPSIRRASFRYMGLESKHHSTFILSVCLQASGDHFHQHWYGCYQVVTNLFVAGPTPYIHPTSLVMNAPIFGQLFCFHVLLSMQA